MFALSLIHSSLSFSMDTGMWANLSASVAMSPYICFLIVKFRLCIVWQENSLVLSSVRIIEQHTMPICAITGHANLNLSVTESALFSTVSYQEVFGAN